jgi:hypothetical protein
LLEETRRAREAAEIAAQELSQALGGRRHCGLAVGG